MASRLFTKFFSNWLSDLLLTQHEPISETSNLPYRHTFCQSLRNIWVFFLPHVTQHSKFWKDFSDPTWPSFNIHPICYATILTKFWEDSLGKKNRNWTSGLLFDTHNDQVSESSELSCSHSRWRFWTSLKKIGPKTQWPPFRPHMTIFSNTSKPSCRWIFWRSLVNVGAEDIAEDVRKQIVDDKWCTTNKTDKRDMDMLTTW